MNPREPEILNELIRQAELTLKAPSPLSTARCLLEEIEDELKLLASLPSDGARAFDDTAIMLARCLFNVEREGPFGGTLMKWQLLAKALLPFVKTDAVRAMDLARPATSEHDYSKRR